MENISGLSFYDSLNKMTIGVLILLLITAFPTSIEGGFMFVVTAFIIGCIYQMGIQKLTSCLTNSRCMIRKAFDKFYKQDGIITAYKPKVGKNCRHVYLLAYYRVARNGILMNIPILEALENFMRNLPLIIVIYLFSIVADCCNTQIVVDTFGGNKCAIVTILPLLLIAVSVMWWNIQLKIHFLIWEGDYYIRLLDNTPNGQTNNATPSNNIPNGQANNGTQSNNKQNG